MTPVMSIIMSIGLVAPRDQERWLWQRSLHHAGMEVAICPVDQMAWLCPSAWVVALPVQIPPSDLLPPLVLTTRALVITPWISATRRLLAGTAHPLMVVHPDRVRADVRRYLTILAHVEAGVVTVPRHLDGGGA